jgi:hypothetical protein
VRIGYAGKHKPNDALAAIYTKASALAPNFEQRWSTWIAGYGGSQTTDGNAALGSNNTRSSVYGSAVGAIAGFSLAGGGTNFSVANGGNGHSDLFRSALSCGTTRGRSTSWRGWPMVGKILRAIAT